MVKFVCKQCGYRTSTKMDYHPKRCPYCSKESLEEEQDAEELIEEVEKILD